MWWLGGGQVDDAAVGGSPGGLYGYKRGGRGGRAAVAAVRREAEAGWVTGGEGSVKHSPAIAMGAMNRYVTLQQLGDGTYGSVVLGQRVDTGEKVRLARVPTKFTRTNYFF